MNLNLPNEIWNIILLYLDDKDLINILYISNENNINNKIDSSLIIKHIDKRSVNFWNKIYRRHFLNFLNKEINFIQGCLESYSIIRILENDLGIQDNNRYINVYNNINNVFNHINNIYQSLEIKLDYRIENIFKSINNFDNKDVIQIILQNFRSPTSICF